jgi:hypothetical protein
MLHNFDEDIDYEGSLDLSTHSPSGRHLPHMSNAPKPQRRQSRSLSSLTDLTKHARSLAVIGSEDTAEVDLIASMEAKINLRTKSYEHEDAPLPHGRRSPSPPTEKKPASFVAFRSKMGHSLRGGLTDGGEEGKLSIAEHTKSLSEIHSYLVGIDASIDITSIRRETSHEIPIGGRLHSDKSLRPSSSGGGKKKSEPCLPTLASSAHASVSDDSLLKGVLPKKNSRSIVDTTVHHSLRSVDHSKSNDHLSVSSAHSSIESVTAGIASLSKKRGRFQYDFKSIGGKKGGVDKTNQDNVLTKDPWKIPGVESGQELQLFALMDGHGDDGEKVSGYIKDSLSHCLQEFCKEKDTDIKKVPRPKKLEPLDSKFID